MKVWGAVAGERDSWKKRCAWLQKQWDEVCQEKYALEERIERAVQKALRPNLPLPDTEDEASEASMAVEE